MPDWTRIQELEVQLYSAHAEIRSLRARITALKRGQNCAGNDSTCPCVDGGLCHYVDSPDGLTKAATNAYTRSHS